jgi:iron complex outermembrane receptor protein
VPLDANHNPDGAFLNERRGALSVGFDRPWGPATWKTTASISFSNQDILRGFLGEVEDAGLNARGIREKIDMTDVYLDSHWAWTTDRDIKLVGGLDYLHGSGDAEGADFDYHADLDGATATLVTPPSELDVKIEDKRDFGGAYGFAEWNPTAAVRLEAGLRLNVTHEERGEEEAAGAEPRGEEGVNNTRLSGSAGIAWTAWQRGSDRLRLFANYRNTFKPAAIDFGIGEEEGEGEGALKPETSQSYELGLKARGWDHRLSLEISAFLMDFDNLVVAQTVGGVPGLINAGQERFKGIEAAVAWHHSSDLGARLSYSLHDAKFTDFVMEFDGVPTQLAGKRLEMSAHHLASAGILYSPEQGWRGLVELNYVGSRYLNKRNTALADGYATLAASIGYKKDKWEARLSGRNLGDRRDPVAESELGDAQYYRLPARRFDLTVSRTF